MPHIHPEKPLVPCHSFHHISNMNEATLRHAAELFQVDGESLKPIGGWDAAVYLASCNGEDYVLRFVRSGVVNYRFRQAWGFAELASCHGIRTPVPLPSVDGKIFEQVDDEHICMKLPYTAGRKLWFLQDEWETLIPLWGRTMARLHRLAEDFEHIGSWQDEHTSLGRMCPDDRVLRKWNALGEFLDSLPLEDYGMMHNDMHQMNIVVTQIALLDWDVAGPHFFGLDIAIPIYAILNGWFRSKRLGKTNFALSFYRNFMSGYREVRDISQDMLELIPVFLKYRQMLQFIVSSGHEMSRREELDQRRTLHRILDNTPLTTLDMW